MGYNNINKILEVLLMAANPKFQVRETEEELQKLDEALKVLGYKDRADWFRDMKRKAIELSKKEN